MEAYSSLRRIAGLLKSNKRVAVFTHNAADGDTLGSGVAACLALEKVGIEPSLVYEEPIPENLSVLPTDQEFMEFMRDASDYAGRVWDVALVFDTADTKLLGKREPLLGQAGTVVNIDHHVTNKGYGDYNHVDAGASAAAEIAWQLIHELGAPIDRDIALSIYTGICTDTGGFSYSNTSASCHEIAAQTLKYGLDVAHLRYKFFDAITLGKLHCHGYAANNVRLHGGGRFAVVVVTGAALEEIGAVEADCEGLVNIGRNIVGVEVSVFAREVRPGEFRVNLRSRGDYDVAEVARKFNGGGHKLAAGCTVRAQPADVERALLAALGAI